MNRDANSSAGTWWALVRIDGDPTASRNDIAAAMSYDVSVDVDNENGSGIIDRVEICNAVYPDMNGPDGPVVYFP